MRARSALFTATIGVLVGVLAWSAVSLPERVPRHFGLDGDVTAFAHRTTYLVGAAVFVAVMAAVFVGCAHLTLKGNLEWFNVPHGDYWKQPERVHRLRSMAADDVWLLGSATMLLFIGLGVSVVVAADDPEPSLPLWFHVLFISYLVGVLAWCWYLVKRRYTPPSAERDPPSRPPAGVAAVLRPRRRHSPAAIPLWMAIRTPLVRRHLLEQRTSWRPPRRLIGSLLDDPNWLFVLLPLWSVPVGMAPQPPAAQRARRRRRRLDRLVTASSQHLDLDRPEHH